MKNFTLHLLRHGSTPGNEAGRYIGITDERLSEKGRAALCEKCEKLHYPAAQLVYSSPLSRCLQSAEIIYPNTLIKTVNDIREYDFGLFENKSMEQLKASNAFRKWAAGGMTEAPEGGENKAGFNARIESGINYIIADMMKNSVTSAAVMTHSGIIMSWLAKYGLPREPAMYWAAEPGCGYTVTTSSYLWGSGETFEIMDRLPIDFSAEHDDSGFEFCNIDSEDSEDI